MTKRTTFLESLSTPNGLRKWAVERIGGSWYQQQKEQTAHIIDVAYQRGPALVHPQQMERMLREIDPQMMDLLRRMQGWEILSGSTWGNRVQWSEQDRMRVVWENRFWYHYDVQIGNAVDMWTDFGFGHSVSILPVTVVDEPDDSDTDEKLQEQDDVVDAPDPANEVWTAFWENPRNKPVVKQRKLAQFSNETVRDGEMFFEWTASGQDGETIVRRVYTEEITNILYEEGDQDVALFYVRKTDDGDVYYPDWEAKRSFGKVLEAYWDNQIAKGKIDKDAKRADRMTETKDFERNGQSEERPLTDVVMQHIALNEINGRGWPQLRRAVAWARALKQLLEDQATVARMVAAYVDEITVDQGSRGIAAVKGRLSTTLNQGPGYIETNPSAPAGSTLLHNKNVSVKRRPLTTGGSDAADNAMLMGGMVSAGSKIPLHWMGLPGAMQNRATARESSRPFNEQMERYQTFWTDVFTEWVEIVLWFDSLYGSKAAHEDVDVVVSLESPLDLEMENVTKLMDSISSAAGKGLIPDWLAEIAMSKLVVIGLEDLGVRSLEPIEPPEGVEPDDDDDEPAPDTQPNPDDLPDAEPAGGDSTPDDDDAEPSETLEKLARLAELNALRAEMEVIAQEIDKREIALEV